MANEWGVGNKADAKAFDTAQVHGQTVDLIMGEHPHSRSDNTIYARFPDGRITGFDGHRLRTSILIEERNYLKDSELSGDEVRRSCRALISLNDALVYGFHGRELEWCMIRAHDYIAKLQEHAMIREMLDVSKRPEYRMDGKKVYYHGVPATLRHWMPDQGCVMVVADDGYEFPTPAYALGEGGPAIDDEYKHEAKEDVLSPNIWWYRD